MKFTKDEVGELINWYFAYPIKDGEDPDYVLKKLMEFHKTDEIELEEALLNGESLREVYNTEARDYFIDNDL